MGIESESPTDQIKEGSGWKIWRNRDLLNRLTSIRVDLARKRDQKIAPKPRTIEHVTADRVGRREFLKAAAGLGVGAAGIGLAWVLRREGVSPTSVAKRFFDPEYKSHRSEDWAELTHGPAGKQEITELYLLKGPDGIDVFVKDLAVFSRSVNEDTNRQVDFTNFRTWNPSDLYDFVKSYVRLMADLRTADGRNQIRQGIEAHAGVHRVRYDENLGKLETWMSKEGLSGNLSNQELERFFKEELGYSQEAWEILSKVEAAWGNKEFSFNLKETINQYNQKKEIPFLIAGIQSQSKENQAMAQVRENAQMAGLVFRVTNLGKVIDAQQVIEIAGTVPAGYSVQELRAATGEILAPAYLAKLPLANSKVENLSLAFPLVLGLLVRGSHELTAWARRETVNLAKKTSLGKEK